MTRRELLAMPAVALLPAPKPVSPGRYGTLRFRPARSVRIVSDEYDYGNQSAEINPPGWAEPGDIHVFLDGVEMKDVTWADEVIGALGRIVRDPNGKLLVDYLLGDTSVYRYRCPGDVIAWSHRTPGDDHEYVKFGSDPAGGWHVFVSCDVATEVLRGRVTLLTTAEIAAGSGPVLS